MGTIRFGKDIYENHLAGGHFLKKADLMIPDSSQLSFPFTPAKNTLTQPPKKT